MKSRFLVSQGYILHACLSYVNSVLHNLLWDNFNIWLLVGLLLLITVSPGTFSWLLVLSYVLWFAVGLILIMEVLKLLGWGCFSPKEFECISSRNLRVLLNLTFVEYAVGVKQSLIQMRFKIQLKFLKTYIFSPRVILETNISSVFIVY